MAQASEMSILIPPERLSREALLGLVDDFVLREGTDYGHGEDPTLDDKRACVLAQIERGEVVIAFDPKSETTNLVERRSLPDDAG